MIITENINAKPFLLKNNPKMWKIMAINQKNPFTMSGKKNNLTKLRLNIVFNTAIKAQRIIRAETEKKIVIIFVLVFS